jgi:hypothetical protein
VPSLGASPEVPCARCGRRIAGLPWGERCAECRAELSRRAGRLASRISLAATVLMAAYVGLSMPPQPMARLYGGIAIVATYIVVRRIAGRVAMEMMT